jgi:hypothetical protein
MGNGFYPAHTLRLQPVEKTRLPLRDGVVIARIINQKPSAVEKINPKPAQHSNYLKMETKPQFERRPLWVAT